MQYSSKQFDRNKCYIVFPFCLKGDIEKRTKINLDNSEPVALSPKTLEEMIVWDKMIIIRLDDSLFFKEITELDYEAVAGIKPTHDGKDILFFKEE